MNRASFSEAEAFLAVVDRGGFGAAARELGVTQSTISRRISALETRLGKRLVERTTRRITLTEAGLAFASNLRDVLTRLAEAEAHVQSEGSEPQGVLRLTMPTAYGRTMVLPRVAALARRYPRLRFELDLSDRYADILDEGFDLAIRNTEPTQTGLVSQRIDRYTLHVCAAPKYLAKHKPIERPQDLVDHDCIVLRTYAPRSRWRLEWSGDLIEIEVSPRIIASDMTAARSMTLEGAGVAILPSFLACKDIESGKLAELLPEAGLPAINVFAAFPHHRTHLSKIKVLIAELQREPA